jgi:hypothetical protein
MNQMLLSYHLKVQEEKVEEEVIEEVRVDSELLLLYHKRHNVLLVLLSHQREL